MRNGCLPMLLIGLILACLSALTLAQSAAIEPATESALSPADLPADPAAATQPADAGAPVDSVAAVAKVYEEMGLPLVPVVEDEQTRITRLNNPQNLPKGAISGQILTEDGQPLEGYVSMDISSPGVGEEVKVTGSTFTGTSPVGTVWICARANGWAFASAGPFEITEDKPVEDVSIVLTRGVSMQVQVRDPKGQPVVGAKVAMELRYGNSYTQTQSQSTDAQGHVTLEHVSSGWQTINVEAPGYFPWRRGLEVAEGVVQEAILAPMDPVSGQVVVKSTGKPMANAKVYLVSGPFDPRNRLSDEDKLPIATTDAQGNFTFRRQIEEDNCLMILSEDHRAAVVGPINPHKPILCNMPEPLYLKATFTGNLKKLQEWSRGRLGFYIVVDNPMPEAAKYSRARSDVFTLTTPVDGKAEFELPLFAPGKVVIKAGDTIVKQLDVTQSVTDLVIDLDNPETPAEKSGPQGSAIPQTPGDVHAMNDSSGPVADLPMLPGTLDQSLALAMMGQVNAGQPAGRELVLKFIPPPGAKEVKGAVRFRGVDESHSFEGTFVQVKDNQAKILVPPGQNPSYHLDHLVGAYGKSEYVRMTAGEAPLVKEIHLQPAGAIRCTVVNEAGEPVDVDSVYATVPDKIIGRYPDLFQGTSALKGKIDDQPTFLLSPMPMDVPIRAYVLGAMSEPITLTAANPVADVKIVKPAGQTVTIHVTNPDGSPATGKSTRKYWSPNSNARYGERDQRTDGAGDYIIGGVNVGPNSGTTTVFVQGGYGQQDASVVLTPGMTELNIQLKAGLHAQGQVVDAASGRPVIGIKVMANVDGSRGMSQFESETMQTDEQGRFEFTQLGEGTYRIYVDGMVRPKPAPKFLGIGGGREEYPTFQAGQTKDVRVEIVPIPGTEKRLRLGEAPTTQPSGSSTQPAGSAGLQPAIVTPQPTGN